MAHVNDIGVAPASVGLDCESEASAFQIVRNSIKALCQMDHEWLEDWHSDVKYIAKKPKQEARYYFLINRFLNAAAQSFDGGVSIGPQPVLTTRATQLAGKTSRTPDWGIRRGHRAISAWECKGPSGSTDLEKAMKDTRPISLENIRLEAIEKTAQHLMQYCDQAILLFHENRYLPQAYMLCSLAGFVTLIRFERQSFGGIVPPLAVPTSDSESESESEPESDPESEPVSEPEPDSEPSAPSTPRTKDATRVKSSLQYMKQYLVVPEVIVAAEPMIQPDGTVSQNLLRLFSMAVDPERKGSTAHIQASFINMNPSEEPCIPHAELIRYAREYFQAKQKKLLKNFREVYNDMIFGNDYEQKAAEEEEKRQSELSPYKPGRIPQDLGRRQPSVRLQSQKEEAKARRKEEKKMKKKEEKKNRKKEEKRQMKKELKKDAKRKDKQMRRENTLENSQTEMDITGAIAELSITSGTSDQVPGASSEPKRLQLEESEGAGTSADMDPMELRRST